MRTYRPSAIELYTPGTAITATAADDITEGQFVTVTDGTGDNPTVAIADPGGRAFGIAAYDAEVGDKLVIQRGHSRCFRLPTTTSLSAGTELVIGDNGQPVAHTIGESGSNGTIVAVALRSTTGSTVDITLV